MAENRPPSGGIRLLRNGAAVVFALLLFYGVPVGRRPDEALMGGVSATVAFVVGVAGLLWLVTRQIRRYLAAPQGASQRVDGILLLLMMVIVFFAQFYYRLEIHDPSQFDGLHTRTDALYYTIVTLGTVGFGDVHAIGQGARIAVMVQIVFDLIVIGTLLAVMSSSIARAQGQTGRDEPRMPQEGGAGGEPS